MTTSVAVLHERLRKAVGLIRPVGMSVLESRLQRQVVVDRWWAWKARRLGVFTGGVWRGPVVREREDVACR